ncbi:hypothetical protein GQ53DRAFT_814145 [Thozetella sp. PMI_491]|nr:hypothetical protein GQ53DRAFT_814145 [Thozetella sp. PMI_491]
MNVRELVDAVELDTTPLQLPELRTTGYDSLGPREPIEPEVDSEQSMLSQVAVAKCSQADTVSPNEVMKAPRSMVTENATPWCHALLYADEMPRAIQDAQACCALYLAKNTANSTAVLRTVDARAKDLVAEPSPPGLLGALARVHAMILYGIILLFDGDPRARASAEQRLLSLAAATTELLQHMSSATEGYNFSSAAPTATTVTESVQALPSPSGSLEYWRKWILEESARRTFLLAHFLVRMYNRLVSLQLPLICDLKLYSGTLWTISAHLWTAQSEVEFRNAWNEKKRWVAFNSELTSILAEAQPDDIDSYGKIFLTSLVGPDEMREWFASKGSQL